MLALPWVLYNNAFLIQLLFKRDLEGSDLCGFLYHKVEFCNSIIV